MSKLIVKPNCCGCGLCVVSCAYLKENEDGNAEYDITKPILERDLEQIRRIVSQCPEKALELVVTKNNNENRDEKLRKIISNFRINADKIKIKKITRAAIPLEVCLRYPSSDKEYSEKYSTKYAAKNAARDEINRLCRYDTAYIPMIRKVFANYKVKTLKKYYMLSDTPQSIFYEYNQQVRKLLNSTYSEIVQCIGASSAVPKKWLDFSVLPPEDTWYINCLNVFENRHVESVARNFESRGKYTSVDWYMRHIQIEEWWESHHSGLFDRHYIKTKYYFCNFYEAVNEFVDDLKTSFSNKAQNIEEDAVNLINGVLQEYEKLMRNQLNNRLHELEIYVKNYQQQHPSSFMKSADSSGSSATSHIVNTNVQKLVNVLQSANSIEREEARASVRFEIDTVFDHGHGELVVYGRLLSGTLKVGDSVFIQNPYGSWHTAKIAYFKLSVDKIEAGTRIGMILERSTNNKVSPKDIITDNVDW